ncbi:MAG: N-6 DNA methylase [Candidatus Riflebacteria bacterium]|nr:N-6 DNA methylase [Candidatus Riflebacteria bacterium]
MRQLEKIVTEFRDIAEKAISDTHEKVMKSVSSDAIEAIACDYWHYVLLKKYLSENGLLNDSNSSEKKWREYAFEKRNWQINQFDELISISSKNKLEALLENIPSKVFQAYDSFGWVYQFWQTRTKFDADLRISQGAKVGSRDISAVTQLFTEQYMVSFILDNTIGAWWAHQILSRNDFQNANSECVLREKVALKNQPFTFLRFHHSAEGWKTLSGAFKNWPCSLKEFRLLDPCCGSGNFLVAAFKMLVEMRIESENLHPEEAVNRVLSENIYGLEIDLRCVEFAVSALSLAAWTFPGAEGFRPLPNLNIACSGMPMKIKAKNLRDCINEDLKSEIENAPLFGSLVNFQKAFAESELKDISLNNCDSAKIFSMKFHSVVTNVPFKGAKKLDSTLNEFLSRRFPAGKSNLATAFVLRIKDWLLPGGTASIVTPHEWLFLTSYKDLRKHVLESTKWEFIADLGEHAFESSQASGAFTALISFSNVEPSNESAFWGIDCNSRKSIKAKREALISENGAFFQQKKQLENPDHRFVLSVQSERVPIGLVAKAFGGMQSGDAPRYLFYFWEISELNSNWELFLLPCAKTAEFTGRQGIIRWEKGKGSLASSSQAHFNGIKAWGRRGVAIRQTRMLPATLYTGEMFDQSCILLVPDDEKHLPALWAFCSSDEFHNEVRKIDKKKNVTYATLDKISFDLKKWEKRAETIFPEGFPVAISNDPTQWIFHGNPAKSDEPLQVAVAELLGYNWPASAMPQTISRSRMEKNKEKSCTDKFNQNNSEFEVKSSCLKSGRHYSEHVDCQKLLTEYPESQKTGQIKISPKQSSKATPLPFAMACFTEKLKSMSEPDGIVCIPSVCGKPRAAERLLEVLSAAYDSPDCRIALHALLGNSEINEESALNFLERWLRNDFFTQHCRLFCQRPFIWHVWDGLADGFSVLLNYHRLDRKNLEKLVYVYLENWIKTQKKDVISDKKRMKERLLAAENLKMQLEKILTGDAPHDIYVRWKPISEQPKGWNPDINDGIRINIRPFMSVKDVGKKGAGILRDKPVINWKNDRGKEPDGRVRINDLHLSLSEKGQ